MHIPDGMLSPAVCAASGAASAAALGWSFFKLRSQADDRWIPLTAATSGLLFAAQMVNFPLFVAPISGHLLGGAFAGIVLGPWAGAIAVSLVLAVQAFVFADGGLMSLGVNILNMAVIGAWGGSSVYRSLADGQRAGENLPSTWRTAAAGIAAAMSVLAAAGLFCLEFAVSHVDRAAMFPRLFGLMVLVHAGIAIGEATITGFLVSWLARWRPESLRPHTVVGMAPRTVQAAVALTAAGLAVAACLAPWASSHPDGLEAVADRLGFGTELEPRVFVWSDYAIPWVARWNESAGVAAAGVAGTLLVILFGGLLVRAFRRSGTASESGATS